MGLGMFYHVETGQLFPSKQKAQSVLKVLSPPLEPVTVAERPELAANQQAELDALPELVGDEWVRGWTVTTIPIEDLRATAQLSRFDFAQRAAAAGYISYTEAAQWAAGNLIPAAVQAIIDSLPAEQQGPVTLDVLAMPIIRRAGSLMPALAAAFQTDDAGLDALFGLA